MNACLISVKTFKNKKKRYLSSCVRSPVTVRRQVVVLFGIQRLETDHFNYYMGLKTLLAIQYKEAQESLVLEFLKFQPRTEKVY